MNKRKMSFVKWADVRDQVIAVNASLVEIIDQISPKDQPHLVEIDYLYGDTVVKHGQLQIPNKNNILVPVKDSDAPKDIINALSYQGIPLFFILTNDNEVFVNSGARCIPLNLFHQGSLLGLFETTNYLFNRPNEAVWSVSAGARTICMLPKISDDLGVKRLSKYYGFSTVLKLKKITDHFEVFKAIANSNNFSQRWINKLLFFTNKWLDKKFIVKYPAFKDYIFQQCWLQAQFSLEQVKLNLMWERFSEMTVLKNLNPGQFLTNQAKHLLNIAAGNLPSLRPTAKSQSEAPIIGLQKAITEVYGLKNNMPIIVSICRKYPGKNQPLYYSLSYPTIFEGSPFKKGFSTIKENLRNLKILMEVFQQCRVNQLEKSLLNNKKFEYFHVEEDPHKELLLSSSIIDNEDFCIYKKLFPKLEFPYASYFWNGCIRIIMND